MGCHCLLREILYTYAKRTLYLIGYLTCDHHKMSTGFLRCGYCNCTKIDSVKDPFMNPLCYQTLLSFVGRGTYTFLIKHWLIHPTIWHLWYLWYKCYYNWFFIKLMRESESQTDKDGEKEARKKKERLLNAYNGKYCKAVWNFILKHSKSCDHLSFLSY